MKIIKSFAFTAMAVLAVTLLFQTSVTRAGDKGKRDDHGQQAQVSFTKWITSFPYQPGLLANMAGVVGGDVGDGSFTGEVLQMSTVGDVTEIVAFYHFHGAKHSFTALNHIVQTGLKAVIVGVVTDGWLKGHAVEGEFTQIKCNHDGTTSDCYSGTLEIQRDSRD